MTETNCICIKWGNKYGPEYVNRIQAGLRRNLTTDLRFFCLTDDAEGLNDDIDVIDMPTEPFETQMLSALAKAPKHGALRKVSLFRPDLIPDLSGPLLAFDLDVVITGPINELATFAPGKVCMRAVWRRQPEGHAIGQGSVIRFDPKLHGYLYDRMAADPEGEVGRAFGSEQTYTSMTAKRAGDFEFFPDDWIASFKYNCRPSRPLNLFLQPKLPPDTRVVCFHGHPNMHEAIDGFKSDIFHRTRACDWLKNSWID